MWKKILFLIYLGSCCNLFADELIVHTLSKHTASTYNLDSGGTTKLNNHNLGLGYRLENGVAFGTYYNSYKRVTTYLAKDFMLNDYLGVGLGATTGYKIATGLDITPMFLFVVAYPIQKNATLRLHVLPPVKDLAGVAHLTIGFKF